MTILIQMALAALLLGAQPPMIAFDYDYADVLSYGIDRFQANYDRQGFHTVTVTVFDDPPGPMVTYVTVPPFTTGTHSVRFRACAHKTCGPGSPRFFFSMDAH